MNLKTRPVATTLVLVVAAITVAILVAIWATGLMGFLVGKGERIAIKGIVKKIDQKYVIITWRGDSYVLVGPEDTLRVLATLASEVEVRGVLTRDNMTLRLESVCYRVS